MVSLQVLYVVYGLYLELSFFCSSIGSYDYNGHRTGTNVACSDVYGKIKSHAKVLNLNRNY